MWGFTTYKAFYVKLGRRTLDSTQEIKGLFSFKTSQAPLRVSVAHEHPRGNTFCWISPDPWPGFLRHRSICIPQSSLWVLSNICVRANISWFWDLIPQSMSFLHIFVDGVFKRVPVVGESFISWDTALVLSHDTLTV